MSTFRKVEDMVNIGAYARGTNAEIDAAITSMPAINGFLRQDVGDPQFLEQSMHQLRALAQLADGAAAQQGERQKLLEAEVLALVDSRLGAVARPARVIFVSALPKTRSGKLLRRALQAVAEHRDPGDLTTMEDPTALQQVKELVQQG